jgi:hypothetical protein
MRNLEIWKSENSYYKTHLHISLIHLAQVQKIITSGTDMNYLAEYIEDNN